MNRSVDNYFCSIELYQEVFQYVINGDGSIGKIHSLKRIVGEVRQIAMNRTDQRTWLARHCSLNCLTRPQYYRVPRRPGTPLSYAIARGSPLQRVGRCGSRGHMIARVHV